MDYSFVFERNLAKIRGEIRIIVDIESTRHSDERKFRHEGKEIEDDMIVKSVKKAIPPITKQLILDDIDIDDPLHIFDKSNNLNVIGRLKGEKLSDLRFVVVTVMIKSNFKPKSGTKTIEV